MMNREAIEAAIHEFLDLKQRSNKQKARISTFELEQYIRMLLNRKGLGSIGDYEQLYEAVNRLVLEGRLVPVKAAGGNGRLPELRTAYWLLPQSIAVQWDARMMLRVSDRLDLSIYHNFPELMTDQEWERIESTYRFLGRSGEREWVTREERSLELFGHEKWLSDSTGPAFLRRVRLTEEDLKIKVFGEPFVFWPRPGALLSQTASILIVENLSMFHTVRRVLERESKVLGMSVDLLIYGEGKKIEASLPFLKDMVASDQEIVINYAGDIDPEGWGIYMRLKRRYPEHKLQLAGPIYEEMCKWGDRYTVEASNQLRRNDQLALIEEELSKQGCSGDCMEMIRHCWHEQRRIPQEVLTVETLRDGRIG